MKMYNYQSKMNSLLESKIRRIVKRVLLEEMSDEEAFKLQERTKEELRVCRMAYDAVADITDAIVDCGGKIDNHLNKTLYSNFNKLRLEIQKSPSDGKRFSDKLLSAFYHMWYQVAPTEYTPSGHRMTDKYRIESVKDYLHRISDMINKYTKENEKYQYAYDRR